MEKREVYYACLERKDGVIIKMPFTDRQEARKYISDYWDKLEYKAAWTE